jgi:hypothetical protein
VRLWRRKGQDPDFKVEPRAREIIAYWEGDRAFLFDAGWGVEPPTLYVPSEAIWEQVVPDWLKGRRAEVIDRLARRSGHRIEETEQGFEPGKGELRPVTSEAEARAIATDLLERDEAPWTVERCFETGAWWHVEARTPEPERYAPALPDGRLTLLIRRDTGEIESE